MKAISNIVAKSIVGNIRTVLGDSQNAKLFRVYGTASKVSYVEQRFGPVATILGEFEAVNAKTGEVFRSTKLNLPEEAMQSLIFELKGSRTTGVKFGFDIGATKAENEFGYKYTVEPLIEFAPRDPFAEFHKLFAAQELETAVDDKAVQTETKPDPAMTTGRKGKNAEAATA